MRTVNRPLEQFQEWSGASLEKHPKFERTISVVNPFTETVLGYITEDTAREIAEWVRGLR